jgi:NAD-dependent SIR2 family protein deacetylase
MTMICKKCKKAFRKDVADMEEPDEADEYCPHCDNHFLREAVTKAGVTGLSGNTPAPVEDVRKPQTYVRS